jgi:protein-glutamine gamma-glutamyltransferase
MSASSEVAVLVPAGTARARSRHVAASARERPVVRVVTFGALALYGVLRWGTLMSPAPVWRLLGLLGLALVLVGGGILIGGRSRIAMGLLTVFAVLAAFAMAGVPVSWVRHLRIAVTADGISEGISGLPRVLLPYLGINQWIRTVMVMGAGVLLLDAALIIALSSPRQLGDGRRAAAATALIALAVIPSTLVRPQLPYFQGLLLFLLVAAFMWADRIKQGDLVTAIAVAGVAGAAAMVAAPALDTHKPWLNYQALASDLAPGHPEAFDWTQRYGPLHWPRTGRAVLEIHASKPEYWKAENLDGFDGRGWVLQSVGAEDAQDTIPAANLRRWTQTLHVTVRAMKTDNVIAAGLAPDPPTHVVGPVAGVSDGTWIDPSGLGPGDSYDISTYDPTPSSSQLASAGTDYPSVLLPAYLTLDIPSNATTPGVIAAPGVAGAATASQQVIFPPFGSQVGTAYSPSTPNPATVLQSSPYARAYALARSLVRRSANPYAYVANVKRYLDSGPYAYNENPPPSRYPLETFLFNDKVGYCQQFAGAMALLLRMGGVPARVAAGFATGTYDSATHSYVVTDTDAHAWVEAWFPSYGWVRFDPTPAAAPALGGHVPSAPIKGSTSTGSKAPASHGLAGTAAGTNSATKHHGGGIPVAALIAVAAAVALLALGLRATLRLSEPTNDELLAELERAFARCGRRVQSGTTLAALEQRLRGSPEAEAYVRAIRLSRFAGTTERPSMAQRRALRRQLRAGLGFAGLARVLWALPPRFRLRAPGSDHPARGLHST